MVDSRPMTLRRFLVGANWAAATFLLWALVVMLTGQPATPQPFGGRIAPRVIPLADFTVGGTALLIRAAGADMLALDCTNTSTTVHVRWGDSTVTTTQGQQLRATGAISIQTSAAVYMISEGANVTVSCTVESN